MHYSWSEHRDRLFLLELSRHCQVARVKPTLVELAIQSHANIKTGTLKPKSGLVIATNFELDNFVRYVEGSNTHNTQANAI